MTAMALVTALVSSSAMRRVNCGGCATAGRKRETTTSMTLAATSLAVLFLAAQVRFAAAQACSAGQYSSSENCIDCAAGKFSAAGASVCTECQAGKYSDAVIVTANPPETSRTYSSVQYEAGYSYHARSMLDSALGWVPGNNYFGEWMQIDLGSEFRVHGVVIQARADSYVLQWGWQYLTEILVNHSRTTSNFASATTRGSAVNTRFFPTSTSGNPIKSELYFNQPVVARYIRIIVHKWMNTAATRAGVLTSLTTAAWNTCAECGAGTFSATTGASICINCGAGWYSPTTGASVASTCTACGAGKYSNVDASACDECRAGKYSDAVIVTANPPETARTYSSVQYEAGYSYHARSMLDSALGWVPGNNYFGEWMQIDLGSEFRVHGVVIQARADSYVLQWGWQYLTEILVNHSRTTSNFASATTRGSAVNTRFFPTSTSGNPIKSELYFNQPVVARYIRIIVHKWMNTAATRAGVLTSLTTAAWNTCAECGAGTFSATTGASICINCGAGWYSPTTGASVASTCTACGAGKYSNVDASACDECRAGKYSDAVIVTANPPETARTYSSVQYEAGYSYHARSMLDSALGWVPGNNYFGEWMQIDLGSEFRVHGVVIQARADSYVLQWGWQYLTEILVNHSRTTSNFASATTRGSAVNTRFFPTSTSGNPIKSELYFNQPVVARYIRIIVHKWMNTAATRAGVLTSLTTAAWNTCAECGAGTFSATTGASICINCGAGLYSPATGASSVNTCLNCPAGRYSSTAGAATCQGCVAGKYKAAAGINTACDECQAGKYSANAGVNFACDNCKPGKYSQEAGAVSELVCLDCPQGKTSAAGSDMATDCTTECAPGWTGAPGACTQCSIGTFKVTTGSATCVACPAYSHSSQPGQSSCQCNAGFTGPDGDCSFCIAGKFKETSGSAACENCNAGKYSRVVGANTNVCQECEAGKYKAAAGVNTACDNCQAGTFSASTGAWSESICTQCPAGKMSQSGSDDITDCTPPTTSGTTTSVSTSTYEVRITLSLPMSQAAFTKDKQIAFKASLAQTAGVASEAVVIDKIESISSRRHLLAEAIRVETRIIAAGEAAAQELAGRLTADSINRELSKAGLPTATVLEAAKPALNPSTTSPELSASNTGTGSVAAEATVASRSSFFSTPVLVGGILGIVFLAGVMACFCHWKCKNHSMAAPSHDTQTPATLEMGTRVTSVNEDLVSNDMEVSSVPRSNQIRGAGELCYKLQEREAEATVPHIPYSELAVEGAALAAGSFKSVYKARWEKKGRNVALLVLRNSNQAALSDMENEIRMFGTLGKHKHLAELLATCTQAQSEDRCMVMEFAPLGSLDHVLSKADEEGIDISNLVKIAVGMQVAEAMTHLHLYNVIHRDLAIRNTLAFQFDPQNWKLVLVKVTDYGLSLLVNKGFTGGASVVEIQTMSPNAAGPTRWMAPESIMRRVYSKKSDVWSFGVVLYEVWTLGMIPYHLIADDKEVARLVTQGERLSRPDNCPQKLYAIMQDCWKISTKDRPSMPELQTALQETFTEESFEAAKTECVVCLSAEPVMALMPCGHRCACADCAQSLSLCPICRCTVQEAKRIFA